LRKILLAIFTAILLIVPSTPAFAVAAVVPTYGTVQPTAGGFVVNITNYDANYTWTPIATNCANATIDSSGWLTVTGTEANISTSVTVYTNQSGYTQSSSTVTGTSSDLPSPAKGSPEGQNSWSGGFINGANGAIFNSYGSWTPSGNLAQVAKSLNHGQSWTVIKTWAVSSGGTTTLAVQGEKVVAAWLDGSSIKSSVSNNSGTTWSNPTNVLTSGTSISSPSAAISADGDIVVAWHEVVNSGFEVHTSSSTNGGSSWSSPTTLSEAAVDSWNVTLQTMASGNIYAIWDTYDHPSGMQYTDSTNTWGARIGMPNRTYYQHSNRGMAVVSSTELSIVWAEGAGNRTIRLATFNGTTWTSPASVATGPFLNPRLAYSATKAVVTYDSGNGVYAITSALSPVSFSGAQLVSPSGAQEQNPSLTWVSAEKFAVTFMQYGTPNMYQKIRISSDGGATWGAAITTTADYVSNYAPGVFTDSSGTLIATWHVQNPNVVVHTAPVASTLPVAAAKELYLVADTSPGSASSNVYAPKAYNGKIYYSATTPDTGREFFVYDGTSVQLLADLNPGTASGAYDSGGVVGVYGGKLLLIADNGTTGWELYAYDGTSISLVLDSRAGTTSGMPANFVEYNGKLYFASAIDADGQAYGWVWDYNSAPQRMSTAYPGYTRQYFFSPTVVGGNLYFVSRVIGMATKLTKFDGTTFTEVATNAGSITQNAAFGNKLLYSGVVSGAGTEPWIFDGTTDTQIADLEAGSLSSNPSQFMTVCSGVIFPAGTVASGRELYFWNTLSAPTMIAEINPGSGSAWPGYSLNAGNGVYFQAQNPTYGSELWFTDGTTVTRLTDGQAGAASFSPRDLIKVGDTIYMAGNSATDGGELFAYGVKPTGFAPATYQSTYTITYNPNTGSGSATYSHTSGSVTLDNGSGFSKSGKVLLGWDTNSSATTATYSLSASYTLSASITLYAVWGDAPAAQNPQPTSPEIPTSADLKNQLGKIPTNGGSVTLEGKNLGTTSQAIVGIQPAVIESTGNDRVTIKFPKLPAGTYDLTLTMNIGKVTFSGVVTYVDSTGNETSQEGKFTADTFVVKGFKPNSTKITKSMAAGLSKRVAKSPAFAIKCQGETSGPVKPSDKALALARARTVCAQVASQLRVKNVTIRLKNNTRTGEAYRRVLVTLLSSAT
jgi:ELWxxDGT repeat protein